MKKLNRRESRVLIRSVPERERQAVRLPAQLPGQLWVVPSAQSRGLPWEAWPELRLDTRSVKRLIPQESRVLSRLVPDSEPLAVRLPAQLSGRLWVVPSARSRELLWEA
jgi:hypothetical protein